MSVQIEKALLIANPAARSGAGLDACRYAERILTERWGEHKLTVRLTEKAQQAQLFAEEASGFDTVIALGGDGVVHEVVNGLMSKPRDERPLFALLPAGTGNDYARTLGMSPNIKDSVQELLTAHEHLFDVGLCNGEYFAETLSFGLDADIAIDTIERRKRTGKTGTRLFVESGIEVLRHRMNKHSYEVSYDGGAPIKGEMYIFAIQIGKTYGGGFTICPEAQVDDGLLDVCIAHPRLSVPKAILVFLLAKNAHHVRFKQIEFSQTQSMHLVFSGDQPVPAQIDGEPFGGRSFDISCVPEALRVLTTW